MNFEQGLASIKELAQSWADNDQLLERNEAQTRLDLINNIVASLGWTQSDTRVEVNHNRTYTDYELGHPAKRIVLEAKREDVYFALPAGWTQRVAKISTVVAGEDAIADAINQALEYALRRGIPYAAVCNGWQLIAFLASRTDGIPPIDGDALVFPSINSMAEDFRTLWDNLSSAGAQEERLLRTLSRPRTQQTSPRLSNKISGYPGFARRHEAQQTLQMLGSVFVEDLATLEENERRFLISCYSHSGALSQYAMASKEILRTRYSLLFDDTADYTVAPALTHTGLDANLLSDIAAASLKQRPILLLGDVGVGKSTFIRNLIHVEARPQLQQAIVFYLDFGKRPALPQDLEAHVASEFERQLLETYSIDIRSDAFVRGVYHGRLEQFKSSIFGPLRERSPAAYEDSEIEFLSTLVNDIEEHLKESLNHISRGQRKQVVIFLDNVDQRDSEFQDRLFVIAQTMAESWPVTVFLALRPETFYESRRSGSLAAYQPRAFSISPPRVEIVLDKRLTYALELLRDGGLRTSSGVEISIDLSTLIKFMETVQRSLQTNHDLMEFLENVSNGNVRDALGYLESYIGSPHVDLRRMLDIFAAGGRFVVPIQDLVKSVLLGDSEYYDPQRSPVGNVFDISGPSRAEHFIVPILVEYIQARGAASSSDGFIELGDIYDFAQHIGYSLDVVSEAVVRATESRFLTRSGFNRRSRQEGRAYRVAPCGPYVVRKLASSFAYLDAVVDDTPLIDSALYNSLNPISHDRDLTARLRRGEYFVKYLDESWQTLGHRAEDVPFDWPSASRAATADIRRIQERLNRGRTRLD